MSGRLCITRGVAGVVVLPLAMALAVALAFGSSSCGGDEASNEPEPAFPADYAATFTEVRNCRSSGDHELRRVRVLADPAALEPYQGRALDFPIGSVVLKEEHDGSDCSGAPVRWTVMTRLAAGSSPTTLDWSWQDVDGARRVTSENDSRCIGCHTGCGVPPDGYLGTCTVVGVSGGAFR